MILAKILLVLRCKAALQDVGDDGAGIVDVEGIAGPGAQADLDGLLAGFVAVQLKPKLLGLAGLECGDLLGSDEPAGVQQVYFEGSGRTLAEIGYLGPPSGG